jgi:hypothetical protein
MEYYDKPNQIRKICRSHAYKITGCKNLLIFQPTRSRRRAPRVNFAGVLAPQLHASLQVWQNLL